MQNSQMPLDSHEHLLDMLGNLMLEINALQAIARDEQPDISVLRGGLAVIEQAARSAIAELRASGDDLPLPEMAGVTLTEALARLVDETSESLGLSSRVTISGDEQILPPATGRALYRLVQESLLQVQQRGNAHKLRFTFHYGHDEVRVSIEDDGIPAAAETPIPHFAYEAVAAEQGIIARNGLDESADEYAIWQSYASQRHRLEHLGGTLEITASAEQGTRVQASVPYVIPAAAAPPAAPALTMTAAARVLIVDNQAVSRAGLRRLLESYPDLSVVGEAADGVQAVSETLELGPQVVLMDALLPNGQSIEALKQIKQLNLDTKVLLLSTQDREDALYEALRAGADGYVLKDIAPDELAQAVRVVAGGEVLVQPQLASRALARAGKQGRGGYPYEALTAREREVLQLLARGLRNKEIATRLYVSERTVNFHLANIYQKLNVSGRTEALSKALEQGLISH